MSTALSLFHSKRLLLGFVLAGFVLLQLACASKSTDRATCDQSDWYELGRRDGAQGLPTDHLVQLRKDCGKTFRNDWETVFINGRNAGLVEYCDAKNGYELGRMGGTYYYVCPSTVEPRFLSSYRKGQSARELEVQNKKIDLQIDQLAQKLVVESDQHEQRQIASELDNLKKVRNKNERELSKIISK